MSERIDAFGELRAAIEATVKDLQAKSFDVAVSFCPSALLLHAPRH